VLDGLIIMNIDVRCHSHMRGCHLPKWTVFFTAGPKPNLVCGIPGLQCDLNPGNASRRQVDPMIDPFTSSYHE